MVESEQFKTEPEKSLEEKALESQGDERAHAVALMELYQELSPALYSYLSRTWLRAGSSYSTMDVEDVIQETWLRALRYLEEDKLSNINNIRSWLIMVAQRVMIDHIRRASSHMRSAASRLEKPTEDEEQAG